MLLNAGMSILGVQNILGHKYVEITLRYASAYDNTVVADFQRACDKEKDLSEIYSHLLSESIREELR
jgi:hypothetical protein